MDHADVRFYLAVFLRRLPLVLVIAAAVGIAGVAVAYFLPPVYRASAKILVEQPQIPTDLARSTVPTNAIEQLQIIEQQITTHENLLALAERLRVYKDQRAQLSDADVVEDMRSRTAFEQLDLASSRSEGATVFSVSFEAADPDLAAKVVNEVVELILKKNMRQRTDTAGETMQFFEQEVARLSSELTRIEAEILKFKNDNQGALPDSLDFRRTQQAGQQERLQLLEREEAALRVRRNNLIQLYGSTGLVSATPLTPEQQMLQDMKRALADQLSIFSDGSPNIVALRARIGSLQKEMQTDTATEKRPAGNKVTSEYGVQVAEIEARLSYIDQEKAAISRELAELNKSIAATANNDTVLRALERNRENIQAQYNAAVARSAQASTGEQIEIRSKGERFSVVELATPPQNPVRPNRLKIAGVGILGAIALGIGVVVLIEFLDGSVRRPTDLMLVLQTKPLATIPYIWTDGERRLKKIRLAGGFALAASIVAVLLVAVQYRYAPISPAFDKLFTAFHRGSGL
ncbi:lipopolysaccharide biosynthesis protein [Pseudaminobacter sp. 19-2017]|uniref:Lipopolysaccharide biosynthesis protein n=1 Tax=Pseudaminobacter soli (ex Zhang et al. 2022) TaxID=2831468 RepID=A0A942I2C1_9HYPH|nr:Wzz/FepE/Etk N-terminal domain-containing protein [Pseudaminobacter soli]MBS3649427.1 lipopolysaccharide biosynthesis protein [Pseudaminobacter soli]